MISKYKDIKIGDICEVGDGAHASIKRQEHGVLYLSSKNFKDGSLKLDKVSYISEEDFSKHFKTNSKAITKLQPGDVALSIIGTMGEPYLVKKTDRFGISSSVAFLRPDLNKVDPLFLFYWLKSDELQGAIYSIKGGVAQGYISLDMIRRLPFRCFGLKLQKKMASILENYDKLIENCKLRVSILENISQNLYNEWFINFKFPEHEKTKFVESPNGLIPESWSLGTLDHFSDIIKEKYRDDCSELPLLDLKKMSPKTLLVGKMGTPNELSTSRIIFNESDILFSSIRPYLHKVALAPCKGVTNTSIFVIRSKKSIYNALMATILFSENTINWAVQYSTGLKMPVIKWNLLSKMPVIIPDNITLQRFDEIVRPMMETIKLESKRIQCLKDTRDIMLRKLITNKLEVSELDIVVNE
jgi:type I restriction enzyme, S subunit